MVCSGDIFLKILFITEQFPYPLDTGGNVRSFHLLKALCSMHAVTLIATTRERLVEEHLQAIMDLCEDVRIVPVEPMSSIRDALLFVAGFVSRQPVILSRHVFPNVRREVVAMLAGNGIASQETLSNLLPGRNFDAVHFNHLDAALYEPLIPRNILRILDEHNVVTNQVRASAEDEGRMIPRLALQREYRRLKRVEPAICNRMDQCFVCSNADARYLQGMGVNRSITVVPNGVDLSYFTPTVNFTDSKDVVFVGTLDYEPCEKGVWFFCTEVLPILWRDMPYLRFIVVGRNPSSRLRALAAADPRIVLTGRVDDIRPHVQSAGVFVAPLLSGSGTRLKILEAMAMGIPVVTTTIGVEGIETPSGEQLLVADNPAEFANAVLSVSRDQSFAQKLRKNARALVESKYSWAAIGEKMLGAYNGLCVL